STTTNGNNELQDVDGDANPDAWTLVRDSMDVVNMATGKTPLRVACIPKVYKTLNNDRTSGDPTVAYSSSFNQNVPMLSDMTKAALNVLDNNTNGFSLMIEGGAVDWAGHDNAAGRLIEEQADFDEAVQAVIDWVEDSSSWDETLLIVTGDHECGYFVGESFDTNDIMGTWEVSDNGQGNMPGYMFFDDYHTNQLVPVYMKGQGAEIIAEYADHDDYVLGKYMDNTEIAQGVFKMWKSLPAAEPNIKSSSVITGNDRVASEMKQSDEL
ncbi:MAG: alkaline phosphatase, partial [Bacteroidota bacterium]